MDTSIFQEPSHDDIDRESRQYQEKRDDNKAENLKSELMAKFHQWLDRQPFDKISQIPSSSRKSNERVSLFTLLSELIALKQETKIANRQLNSGVEQCKKMSENMQQAVETAQRAQNQCGAEITNQKARHIRPLLQGILDIRDRMEQGIIASQKTRSSFMERLVKENKSKNELIEGQQMTLRNLDKLLESFGVSPIDSLGKIFDPYTMQAVEVERCVNKANGLVTEEIRKGFLLHNEVLRFAEVKVNRTINNHYIK
ncbi:MAG: nucleotide exchange factor GrpE [bacterium]